MTLAEHAVAWWVEQGNTVPVKGSVVWEEMYRQWVDFAFPESEFKGIGSETDES